MSRSGVTTLTQLQLTKAYPAFASAHEGLLHVSWAIPCALQAHVLRVKLILYVKRPVVFSSLNSSIFRFWPAGRDEYRRIGMASTEAGIVGSGFEISVSAYTMPSQAKGMYCFLHSSWVDRDSGSRHTHLQHTPITSTFEFRPGQIFFFFVCTDLY